LAKKSARRRIVFGFNQHAEQLDVVGIEHDGEIARSHFGAVGAARRHRETKAFPVLRSLIEIPDHDDGMINSDDIVERHAFVSSGRN